MKKQCIKTFKQIYKDQKTQERKEYSYTVQIVKDTDGYKYRIMNMKDVTIWNRYFDTFGEAEEFLNKHPHNVENQIGEV